MTRGPAARGGGLSTKRCYATPRKPARWRSVTQATPAGAHNASIVAGYLDNESLAADEGRVERFFINVILVRVLFAHALVAAPRLALGSLAPVARPAGDPRVGMTGIFLSLSRVLLDRYPLGAAVAIGIIAPRFGRLYEWSSEILALPALRGLLDGSTPTYAWDAKDDADVWDFKPSRLARLARRIAPAR